LIASGSAGFALLPERRRSHIAGCPVHRSPDDTILVLFGYIMGKMKLIQVTKSGNPEATSTVQIENVAEVVQSIDYILDSLPVRRLKEW